MKKYQIFYLFALLNININAQNKLNDVYIEFAEKFLSAMKSNDINEYRKLYATKEEFEDFKDKRIKKLVNRRSYMKNGGDKLYQDYNNYKNKLDSLFKITQELNNLSDFNWKNFKIEYIYLKDDQNDLRIIIKSNVYYLIALDLKFFNLKDIFYHNELKLNRGYIGKSKIGNIRNICEFWQRGVVANNDIYKIILEKKLKVRKRKVMI